MGLIKKRQNKLDLKRQHGDVSAKNRYLNEIWKCIGIDLLKFQVASYSGLDKIDVRAHLRLVKLF